MAMATHSRNSGRRTKVRSLAPVEPFIERPTYAPAPTVAAVVTTRVLVHARRKFLRDGVAFVLDGQPSMRVVASTHRNADLLEMCTRANPDVVVIHVELLDLDLITTVSELRQRFEHVRVVVVGGRVHAEQWSLARGSGVDEVVASSAGADTLSTAVRGEGGGRRDHPSNPMRRLTMREHRILELVGHGLKAREIAEKLGITTKTVESHKQRIFAKLGVQNQAHAVSIAVRAGVLRPEPDLRASGNG